VVCFKVIAEGNEVCFTKDVQLDTVIELFFENLICVIEFLIRANSKNVLGKAFFFTFAVSFLIGVLCPKILKTAPPRGERKIFLE
jgi:hypothetical protein